MSGEGLDRAAGGWPAEGQGAPWRGCAARSGAVSCTQEPSTLPRPSPAGPLDPAADGRRGGGCVHRGDAPSGLANGWRSWRPGSGSVCG